MCVSRLTAHCICKPATIYAAGSSCIFSAYPKSIKFQVLHASDPGRFHHQANINTDNQLGNLMKLPNWLLANGQQHTDTQATTSPTKCGFQVGRRTRPQHTETQTANSATKCGFQFGRRPAGNNAHRKQSADTAAKCAFQRGRRPTGNNTQRHRQPTRRPTVASNLAAGQRAATHTETQTANSATKCGFQFGRRPAGSNTQRHRHPTRRSNVASNLAAGQRTATHRDTDNQLGDQMWLPIWPPASAHQHTETQTANTATKHCFQLGSRAADSNTQKTIWLYPGHPNKHGIAPACLVASTKRGGTARRI